MGCYVAKCKFCKHEVAGSEFMELYFSEGVHIKEKHPKIHKQNRDAKIQYDKDTKKALEKQLKNSITPTFNKSKWVGEAYAEDWKE